MSRWCRICGGEVIDDAGWVTLEQLGRFWLCPEHHNAAAFVRLALGVPGGTWAYRQVGRAGLFVLGPYPYKGGPA